MKTIRPIKKRLLSALALALLGLFSASLAASPEPQAPQTKKANRYIGATKCKNCHGATESGNQFECWTKAKHAEAFKTLGTDAAKKVATEKGIADAQKDEKCTKCHVTAVGVPEEQIMRGFDRTQGVQCETCHGPGEAHMKARMAEAMKEDKPDPKVRKVVPEGEILVRAGPELCLTCHNSESPSFKKFCYPERLAKIAHYDPRSDRKAKAPACKCGGEDKCTCTKAECSKEEKKEEKK